MYYNVAWVSKHTVDTIPNKFLNIIQYVLKGNDS